MSLQVTVAAPIDPADLAPVLDPAGTACMLPAAAYRDDAVLAWERTHLFADAWVCAGRSTESRRRRVTRTPSRSATTSPPARPRRRRRDAAASSTCASTGPASWSRAGRPTSTVRSTARTTAGATRSTARCCRRPASTSLPGSTAPSTDSSRSPSRTGMAGPWSTRRVPRRRSTCSLTASRRVVDHEPGRLVVGATHSYELAANWKLIVENYHECVHCPIIHPELCAISPARERRELQRPRRDVGRWVAGPRAGRRDDVVQRPVRRGAAAQPPRCRPPAHRLRRTAAEHAREPPPRLRDDAPPRPIAPDRTAVECQWLFAPEAVAADGFDPSFAVDFWDVTNRQDWAACEGVQRGVASRGFHQGPFSTEEDAVAQFVRLVATAYLAGGWMR